MVDRIELRELRIVGICGALPEERERPQPLEFDVDVELDLTAAAASDALDDTVDYGVVCDLVADTVTDAKAQLLEHLAARVAEVILGSDPRIQAVTVTARKRRPPVPYELATSGVTVRRAAT